MKKIVSCALVLTMLASLTGCFSKGGFSGKEKKFIKAAENCCGASEATKKQKKEIKQTDFTPSSANFEDGAYVTFGPDDLEDFNFDQTEFDEEDMKNMFLFVKSEESASYIIAYVIEATDEDAAETIYDHFLNILGTTEKELKKSAKKHDAEYGFEDDDDMLAAIMASEDLNKATGVYLKRDSKVISICYYEGKTDADLYEEYFEFSKDAGLTDMEALME